MIKSPVDTTVKIWDYLYKVTIPFLDSRSVADIKRFGVTMTGVEAIDKVKHGEIITTMMSIADMVEHHKEGVKIAIVRQEDIKIIYQDVIDHIQAWRMRLERGINIGDAPIDDLISMDEFANSLFAHARHEYSPDMSNSDILRQLGNVERIGPVNFFKDGVQKDDDGITKINSKEDDLPTRDSMGDFFKSRLIGLNRR